MVRLGTFENNYAALGGGSIYLRNAPILIISSNFSSSTSHAAGDSIGLLDTPSVEVWVRNYVRT